MNKGSSEAVCSKERIWGRQVAGCARAVRQYDLDTEISQTCRSKRHCKAGMSLNGSVVIA